MPAEVISTLPLALVVVLLNGLGEMVFAGRSLRHGIEAAMVRHFAADVVLHVIGPGLFTGGRA